MNINGYKETVIATTDRVQVVLMLYEGTSSGSSDAL
jgi:hypothetical protein